MLAAPVPPVAGALFDPVVTPGTAVGGVSLMPRGNGLSLVLLRMPAVPPAAAAPAAAAPNPPWIETAGLCCATVLVPSGVVVATTPFTCVVPSAVGSAPPT